MGNGMKEEVWSPRNAKEVLVTRGSTPASGIRREAGVACQVPTYHSQVPVLGLGDEQFRARCKVDNAVPAGAACKRDAGRQGVCEDGPPCVHPAPHSPYVPHLPWLMFILFTRSALRAVLVSVSITWSLCSTTSPWETQAREGVRLCLELEDPAPPCLPVPQWYLLLIVLTLHVEHEEAVTQAADRDS